jgi:hypothetical protein
MTCKECTYFKGGFCSNLDTIVDRNDRACMGYAPKVERREVRRMKLLIETPAKEIMEKLKSKKAYIEEDLEGIVLNEVLNINPGSLGIRVIFMSMNGIPEEIELINSDFRLLHLFIN